MARLIINVEDIHVLRDGDVFNLTDHLFLLGETGSLDWRYIEKLEILEILVRERRMLLQDLKCGASPSIQ